MFRFGFVRTRVVLMKAVDVSLLWHEGHIGIEVIEFLVIQNV